MTLTEIRYVKEGCNGTLKDTIIELNNRLRGLKSLADVYEKRGDFEKYCGVLGKMQVVQKNLWDTWKLIPSEYTPKTLVINQ